MVSETPGCVTPSIAKIHRIYYCLWRVRCCDTWWRDKRDRWRYWRRYVGWKCGEYQFPINFNKFHQKTASVVHLKSVRGFRWADTRIWLDQRSYAVVSTVTLCVVKRCSQRKHLKRAGLDALIRRERIKPWLVKFWFIILRFITTQIQFVCKKKSSIKFSLKFWLNRD